MVGKFETLLASARAFLNRSVREESGSMIKSSIGHVIRSAFQSLPPLSVNALGITITTFVSGRAYSFRDLARAMSKRPMAPSDSHKPRKRHPGQSINHMPTQVPARDIPIYFKKRPPRDPNAFVYVEVVMVWPAIGKVSFMDVRMTEAKHNPARFHAFFTGDCTGFPERVNRQDKLCLYLSDATVHEVEEQCKQNTLNFPFTLNYDKECRLKYVEKGMVGRSVTFPTRT